MSFRPPQLASMQDIIQWADLIISRSQLPNLVRPLVRQTNDTVLKCDMGGDEEIDFGDYDGKVVAGKGTPFVPEGASVWEFGVGNDFKDKAQKDYKKRTGNSRGVDMAQTTFVFVTPRRWADSETWVQKKKAEGNWKDVVVFDAADLYAAMEGAPAAHIKFSESINKPANSVAVLEDWWTRYSGPLGGLLSPELVLAGRADQAASLLRLIQEKEKGHTLVAAASVDDVLAFVASTLLTAPPELKSDLLERALVVFEPGALRFLDSTSKLLILLPFDESLVRQADLVVSHHVILHTPAVGSATISLPKIPVAEAEFLLTEAGVSDKHAHELALASFRSIPLFKSKVMGVPTVAGQALAVTLVSSATTRRAWLLGSWDSGRTGDSEVFADIIGPAAEPYESLQKLVDTEDPVFSRIGSTWKVISPSTNMASIGSGLSVDDLARFESVVQTVLGAVDPTLQVAAAERWKVGIYGPARLHSSDLRKGIATTLALFGARGETLKVGSGPTLRGWAELAVRALLERANSDETGQLWLSLGDVLPLIAEAAPDIFLDAVDLAIDVDGLLRPHLFADRDDDWSSSSPHVHLLWALETLAWSADYLAAVTDLLARLAEFDPGGKLSNRPLATLTNTFRPWMSQTAAEPEERIAVLRELVRRHP